MTAAVLAQRDGLELSALTVHYGQSHARELESARRIAECLGIQQRIIDAPFFGEVASYSALTRPSQHPPPLDRTPLAMSSDVPITYVPLRNTYLLTLAAAALESRALDAIEQQRTDPAELSAAVVIGANAIDYSGYPDCRPEYYRAATETLRLGSKLGTSYGVPIAIDTPLIQKTKSEIVRLAFELGAPVEHTWSCYGPGPAPCGRCDSCLLREKGFREAGLTDPALAASRAES
jgi:7-cyano-7-deazaguanine synthase